MSLSSQPIPKHVRKLIQQSLEVHRNFETRLRQLAGKVVEDTLLDKASFLKLCSAIQEIELNLEALQFDNLIAGDTIYILERYMELQCPFDPGILLEVPDQELQDTMEDELAFLIEEYLLLEPSIPAEHVHKIAEEKAGIEVSEYIKMDLPQLIQAIFEPQPKLSQEDWDILQAVLLDSTMRHREGSHYLDEACDLYTPLFLEEGKSVQGALKWAEHTRQFTKEWLSRRGKPQKMSSWLEHTAALIAPYEEEEEGEENIFPLRDSRNADQEESPWFPLDDPKFEPGTMVKVTVSASPNPDFPDLSAEGWHGWVEAAVTDGQQREYTINLDSKTLRALPAEFIKSSCEAFMTPDATRYRFSESDLQPVVPRERPEDTRATQRDICHRYFWGDVEQDDQAARIHRILMRDPSGTDLENWMAYFGEEVHFPFKARVEGMVLQHIEQGTEVEVVGVETIDDNGFGLVASIKKGRAILSFPLMELVPAREAQEEAQALEDYRYWADFMLL